MSTNGFKNEPGLFTQLLTFAGVGALALILVTLYAIAFVVDSLTNSESSASDVSVSLALCAGLIASAVI